MITKSAIKAVFSWKILRTLLIIVILRLKPKFKYATNWIDKYYIEKFALLKNVDIVCMSLQIVK